MATLNPDAANFVQPSLDEVKKALRWQRAWFRYSFYGLENIEPQKPALYIGNHTMFGTLDGPLMVAGLYEKTGLYLRSLGDHFHFQVPGWRDAITRFGAVPGTRENCAQLMQSGQSILIYPGGGREVLKNKDEAYKLIWKERLGFAAMAMKYGYDIVPFGAVGAEEAFDIHYDSNDFKESLLGKWLSRTGLMQKYLRNGELFSPIVSGVAGLPIPRPQPLFFGFGERISTQGYEQHSEDADAQWEVRGKVEQAVNAQIELMLEKRAEADNHSDWRKFLVKKVEVTN